MRSFLKHLIVWSLLCGLLLVPVNLPMQLESVLSSGTTRPLEGEFAFADDALPLPVAAGWPETFYQRFDDLPDGEP